MSDETLIKIQAINKESEDIRNKNKERWKRNIEKLDKALSSCGKEDCPGRECLRQIKEEEDGL